MAGLNKRVGEVYRTAATFALNPEYLTFVQNVAFGPAAERLSAGSRSRVRWSMSPISPRTRNTNCPRRLRSRSFARHSVCPCCREGEPIGVIFLARDRVEPFTARQIELVRTFADQAVIAMENARLLGELRERTDDLQESLEYQTATSDVLKVISRSSVNLETVLDTLVGTVVRLCRADQAGMYRLRDGGYHIIASRGLSEEAQEFQRTHPLPTDRGSMSGRTALERRAVHIPDVLQDPEYTYREGAKVTGYRTLLGVPLLREETLVGTIVVARPRVEPFTDKEIELVRTFADQAVIAIENARLFAELRKSLEQQTATAEVLQVINSSPGNLAPVFDALLGKALGLCDAAYGILWTYEDGKMHAAALRGVPPAYADFLTRHGAHEVGENNAHGRLLRGEPIVAYRRRCGGLWIPVG